MELIKFDSPELHQFCNHCGESVEFGTGRFVNRIPDLNNTETRIANNLTFPLGDFLCEECDSNPQT
ncbi:MAG: hypothetical protein A2X64_03280 [Ignavibacteria bacterium GWF2_33_9]|nr:MAG: hypothetical protein A2X64_03280 [Ignavibacteria bacterium GWF2_33_9]